MEKHFEPVTARSLAERIMSTVGMGNYFADYIESILDPYIRKPSYDDKSVPARCEEAYNEAVELIKAFAGEFTHEEFMSLRGKADRFINKTNPFKEAEIVKDGDKEPALLPFSLELAEQGHKVVTSDRIEVKIVADGLSGEWPLLAVYTDRWGTKQFDEFNLKGQRKDIIDDSLNLFIMKEPKTIPINVYRNKYTGILHVNIEKTRSPQYDLVKTITTTI